ncbi:MAG: terminase [Betaproteobacteria bacterium]|nr:terminase [Betaproteobacteria bacterium]
MSAPRKFDRDSITAAICARLCTGHEPLTVICADLGLSPRTVRDWRQQDAEIGEAIDEAFRVGTDALAAECLVIADTPQEGTEIVERGGKKEIHHGDMLGHRKLQIETRMKLLAKWDKRNYGDKLVTENTNINLNTDVVDIDEMDRRLDRAVAAALAAAGAVEPES